MQKVKFEAATGEELRQQMLDFLLGNGGQTTTVVKGSDITAMIEKKAEAQVAANEPALTIAAENTPATTTQEPVKKRRTKAEIEAEKAALAGQTSETPAPGESQSEEEANAAATQSEGAGVDAPKEEEKKAEGGTEITRAFLTEIVLGKGREGKKNDMLKIFATFMQADGATPVGGLPTLQEKDYAAAYEQLKDL